jgi:hypothetical protein
LEESFLILSFVSYKWVRYRHSYRFLPPLSDWWGCYIKRTQFSPGTSIESIKHWCDWLATVFQIVIVASIGGVIFTEGSAQFFRRFSDRLNEHIENSTENNTKERSEFVRETVERIEYIASSNNHNIVKAGQIIRLQYDLFQKAILLPNYYYWFIFRGLIVNFPGGLYGLLAFMFLFLQILTITTKMSLDYISQNTCS